MSTANEERNEKPDVNCKTVLERAGEIVQKFAHSAKDIPQEREIRGTVSLSLSEQILKQEQQLQATNDKLEAMAKDLEILKEETKNLHTLFWKNLDLTALTLQKLQKAKTKAVIWSAANISLSLGLFFTGIYLLISGN